MSDQDRRNQLGDQDSQDERRDRELGEVIRSGATYHAASPALRREITGALRAREHARCGGMDVLARMA